MGMPLYFYGNVCTMIAIPKTNQNLARLVHQIHTLF